MIIVGKIKYLLGLITLLLMNTSYAQNTVSFNIDTTNFGLTINGKKAEKSNLKAILSLINNEYRKVESTNKTRYIYDQLGFVVEQDLKGISYIFYYTISTKVDDPKGIFISNLSINQIPIIVNTKVDDIKNQFPKVPKIVFMEGLLLYINKNIVVSCESKNGALKELGIGFKLK